MQVSNKVMTLKLTVSLAIAVLCCWYCAHASSAEDVPAKAKELTADNGKTIAELQIVGNKTVSTERINALNQVRSGQCFSRTVLDEDICELTAYYRALGFFCVTISDEIRKIDVTEEESKTSEKTDSVGITILIEEGLRYKIRNVSFSGNIYFEDQELVNLLENKRGDYFNQDQMTADLKTLQKKYMRAGFKSVVVTPDPRFLEENGTLDLIYNIREGYKEETHRTEEPHFYFVPDEEISPPSTLTDSKPKDAGKSLEQTSTSTLTLPDGTKMTTHTFTMRAEDGWYEEMKKLIAKKKYMFVRTFEAPNGEKQYIYSFTLADGSNFSMKFSINLEKVLSWDDYLKQQEEQRQKKINRAITSGKFRLINLEVMQIHLCRDMESNKKFEVLRLGQGTERDIAFPKPGYIELPPSVKETSWQEHLQAIHNGKRELLELETVHNYTYEITTEDRTKIIFNYSGDAPLKMPEKKQEGDENRQRSKSNVRIVKHNP